MSRLAMLLALITVANVVLLALLLRAFRLLRRLEGELGHEACRVRGLEVELRRLHHRADA